MEHHMFEILSYLTKKKNGKEFCVPHYGLALVLPIGEQNDD